MYIIEPKVFICIPVHNRITLTIKCLESIYTQDYKNIVTIICDDNSTDDTFNIVSHKFPLVILLRGNGNYWWAGAMNECVRKALTIGQINDYIFTLNNDTELEKNTLTKLVCESIKTKRSVMGAVNLFYYNRNKIEPSAFKLRQKIGGVKRINNWGDDINKFKGNIEVDSLSGKGVLIPSEIFRNIGYYNNTYLPHYHSDNEFLIRAHNRGYRIFICYDAYLYSHQDKTGYGTKASKPDMIPFINSFFTIKSPHHLTSLYHFNKLISGKKYVFTLTCAIIAILLGFLKRFIVYHWDRYRK